MTQVDLRLCLTAANALALQSSALLPKDPMATKAKADVTDDMALSVWAAVNLRIERRIWTVDHDGAALSVALDRGTVTAFDRQAQICEIGLRMLSGPPAALFRFARMIDTIAPIRAGVMTKAERCHAIAQPLPQFFKADPVALSPDTSTEQAFQLIMLACLRQYRLNEDILLFAPTPEAVHQARVALRRMRAALVTFKPMLGQDRPVDLRLNLRWLAQNLGDAREIDVLLPRVTTTALRQKLTSARKSQYGQMVSTLKTHRARAIMLDLTEWVHLGAWRDDPATADLRTSPVTEYAVTALRRLWRKLRKNGMDLHLLTDRERHDLRKHAKKLRYGTDFFANLFQDGPMTKPQKRFVNRIESLQESLGALNDMATDGKVLGRLGFGGDIASLPGSKGAEQAAIADAAKSYRDLIKAKAFWK